MRRCNDCKTFSPDASQFCTSCGASFGVRYCQRLHPNFVGAEYCAVCGSRELSRSHEPTSPVVAKVVVLVVTALGATGGAVWTAVWAWNSIAGVEQLKTILVVVVAGVAALTKPRKGTGK